MNLKNKLRHLGLFSLLALPSLVACSDSKENASTSKNEMPNFENSQYAITAFWEKNGQKNLIRIPPAMSNFERNKNLSTEDSKKSSEPQKTTSNIALEIDNISSIDSGFILKFAANQCGVPIHPDPVNSMAHWSNVSAVNPWSPGAFFVFSRPPSSCDQSLVYEETMLCMADQINSIADAVDDVVWNLGGEKLTFPPQSTKNRFIARDLARNTIAHIGYLDALWHTNESTFSFSCDAGYFTLLLGPNYLGSTFLTSENIFGVSPGATTQYIEPSLTTTQENLPALIGGRLKFQSKILRGAGNLLNKIIKDSVFEDLAGAESARSKATDPLEGNRRAWGLHLPGPWNDPSIVDIYSPAYNSLEHAVQVLAGRLEVGPNPNLNSLDDPLNLGDARCGGLRSSELLRRGFGPEMTARAFDTGVQTKGQTEALVMIARAGLVIAPSTYGSNVEVLDPSIKSFVLSYLKAVTAWERGFKTVNNVPDLVAFEQSDQAAPFEASFNRLQDGDIRFALHRVHDLWRLHTSRAESDPISEDAGLTAWPFPAPEPFPASEPSDLFMGFSNLGPQDLSIDITARLGGIQEASQCPGDLDGSPTTEWSYTYSDPQHQEIFQDSFSMAQHFGRRLVYVREVAKHPSLPSDTHLDAASGAAEMRTWAGPGQFRLQRQENDSFELFGIGFEPKDLGVNNLEDVLRQIVLVYGEPWKAECIAGIRKTCPENIDDSAVLASSVALSSPGEGPPMFQGTDYGAFRLIFDWNSSLDEITHVKGNFNSSSAKHLYVIQRHDPTSVTGEGRVLGALALRGSVGGTSAPIYNPTSLSVSNLQRKLFNDVLAVPKKWDFYAPSVGFATLSNGRSFCIDDVSWDQFVPLENELTSDSDQYENSWRHYLNLAKVAADETDRLGNEMIQIGLQQELRREAALEVVGDLCGTYTEGANSTIDKGKVVAPPADTKMQSCLSNKRKDIVIFAKTPDNKNLEDPAFAKEILNCPTEDDPKGNPKCARTLSVASLELVDSSTINSTQLTPTCQQLAGAVESMVTGYDGNVLNGLREKGKEWLTSEAFASMTQSMRMVVEDSGDWHLDVNYVPIMGSKPTSELWPGCLRQESVDCDKAREQAIFFSRVFRSKKVDPKVDGENCAEGKRQIGNSCVDVVDDTEIFPLLWRVESAFWMMANIAGKMPEKAISGYFPAAVLRKEGTIQNRWDPSNPLSSKAPIPAIYGNGEFATAHWLGNNVAAIKLNVDASGNSEEQSNILGDLTAIPTPWVGPSGLSQEVPEWLRDITSQSDGYGLIFASNPEFQLSPGPLDVQESLKIYSDFKGAICFDTGAVPRFHGEPFNSGATWSSLLAKAFQLKGNRMNHLGGDKFGAWQLCPSFFIDRGLPGDLPSANVKLTFADFFTFHEDIQSDPFTVSNVPSGLVSLSLPTQTLPFFNLNGGAQSGIKDLGVFVSSGYSAGHLFDHSLLDENSELGAKNPSCRFSIPQGSLHSPIHLLAPSQAGGVSCLRNVFDVGSIDIGIVGDPYSWKHAPQYVLSPSVCSPGSRLPLFTNAYPPPGECGAIAQITQAYALACSIKENGVVGRLTEAPPITSAAAIISLRSWADSQAEKLQTIVGRMYVEDIPDRIVDDIIGNKNSAGESGGHQRDLEQNLSKTLRTIPGSWNNIATTLKQISNALDVAEKKVNLIEIDKKINVANIWKERLGLIKDMLSSLQKMADTITEFKWPSLGTTIYLQSASLIATTVQLKYTVQIQSLTEDKATETVGLTLVELNGQMIQLANTMNQQLIILQGQVSDVISLSGQLRENEQKVAYQLGKATGAPYVFDQDGNPILYPVNQVLQRQYDATRARYDRSLKNAKYLSFMARRAIEQRVGKPLSEFKENLGPLPPPYEWANDVCSLQGIDYDCLKAIDVPGSAGGGGASGTSGTGGGGASGTGGSSGKACGEFADQFIGDYVRKLEYFVEYYNIKHPSHDGDDQVVLSLRDDLLGRPAQCSVDGPNRLYFSGHLENSFEIPGENGTSTLVGWSTTPCQPTDAECLKVHPGVTLLKPDDYKLPELLSLFERATWLHDEPPPEQGTPAPPADPLPAVLQKNPASVFQKLYLEPGNYVLSWFDQARLLSGDIYTTQEVEVGRPADTYRFGVLDESGGATLADTLSPFRPVFGLSTGAPNLNLSWSPRREYPFEVKVPGTYYVLFGASPGGSQERGSVLLRDVQLEVSSTKKATPFVETSSTRTVTSTQCPKLGALDVQKAFTHRCEDSGLCFYELNDPVIIDTIQLNSSKSPLQGKLAAGNFNYRHITVALNLAGTALVDCSKDGDQSCYGSGYLEYTLDHDAFLVNVLGYDNKSAPFNFGSAAINHGKGLAAERYMTIPLSGADSALLAQPSIEKPEFRGRPLDGSYHLRIWDRPGLTWEHLEDVQLVLRYRYWSNITAQPAPAGG